MWIPFRWVMLGGMLLMVVGFVLLDMMNSETTIGVVRRNVGLLGAGMGLVMITQLLAVQSSVPRDRLGIATSTSQFFRSTGGAIGIAIMGTVMVQRMQVGTATGNGSESDPLQQLIANPSAFLQPATRELLSPEVVALFQSVLADALHTVFLVGTVVGVLGLSSVAMMPGVKLTHTERQ